MIMTFYGMLSDLGKGSRLESIIIHEKIFSKPYFFRMSVVVPEFSREAFQDDNEISEIGSRAL